MALTLVTNPVGSGASKIFAGFQKCEVIFKREDLQINTVEAGSGGAKIKHTGDLTSLLAVGDSIYLYSETANYVYDGIYQILVIVAGEITVSAPFIETGTGGYINYLKNYYVELQCVRHDLTDVNLLPFVLQTDGDAKGNISIDVSIINELTLQRGPIEQGASSESVREFVIKYREVYQGSSNSYTLVSNKLFIFMHTIDIPEEETILNNFDEPQIYLGYQSALSVVLKAMDTGSKVDMTYNELDINKQIITTSTLGELDSDQNSIYIWEWKRTATANVATKYIDFNLSIKAVFDFLAGDFASPDFLTE